MKTRTKHTYRIEVREGYSGVDHLAPKVRHEYPTLAAARAALKDARNWHPRSAAVRCDIVRSDGRRFEWE